ncbi:glycogen debranching N-terminal domain-containing protein [Bifidobacterium aquikefiricola]|uniref:Glycogen debranching N-terminal domain-containing protein n=1 Tax=Bifidobacterium aquikefiricola TaxID=3059038 RepID=A0AB39U6Q6_9BIFI
MKSNDDATLHAASAQPWVHDKQVILSAPAQLWSSREGAVDGHGISGFYVGDTRLISKIEVTINGLAPELVNNSITSSHATSNTYLARNISGATVDPVFRINEFREINKDALTLRFQVLNGLHKALKFTFGVQIRIDNTDMQSLKGGMENQQEALKSLHVQHTDAELQARSPSMILRMSAVPVPSITYQGLDCTFQWDAEVGSDDQCEFMLDVNTQSPTRVVIPAQGKASWHDTVIDTGDKNLDAWIDRSLRDLEGLRMSIPSLPNDEFFAAGAPWFFTLFGRDSLWAARFMLPITSVPALGTLRTLAHFQADEFNLETNAEPGKIPHELRAAAVDYGEAFSQGHLSLPPLYYGTIDATALWIILFAELVDSGISQSQAETLLPHMERALSWMREFGDADGDGFLEYIDVTGHGLTNQGWKDSGDSVRWMDGTIAEGPIALCEVQGYAYQAAMDGARVLDAFGRDGAVELRAWASKLKERFSSSFWLEDEFGPYPAVALDGHKHAVNSVASNMGHLLGTGILEEDEVQAVSRRLMSSELNSGYGIRTLSCNSGGYWPLSYHCGSVWAHDTAIAMLGLYREGEKEKAREIGNGLIDAAAIFNYQMPELFSGDKAPNMVAYPASCHPQAWSAASSIAVYEVFKGDVR